jgi:hypothetical protein
LGVPEITLEKLEEEAKADIVKELGKVRQKLDYYIDIQESPQYEEGLIVRTKVGPRPSYKRMAQSLAEQLGVPIPKVARTEGKTWKQIYRELLAQKNKGKSTEETS